MAKISFSTEVPELLTFAEAADVLGMARPSLYYMVDTNKLHRINIGNSGYLLKEEVDKLKKEKNGEAGVAVTPASG